MDELAAGGIDLLGQTGYLSCGCVAVNDTFLGGIINNRFSRIQFGGCIGLDLTGDCLPNILYHIFNPGLCRFVAKLPIFILARTFQC